MDRKDDQSTDGASIKPVSSLLSHFEGLKSHQGPGREVTQAREAPAPTNLNTPRPTLPIRASLDLPRPESSWGTSAGQSTPRTPGDPQKGRTSPVRSSYIRPKSMHMQSSPQLTPSVQVDSPQSPPYTTFFQRSASRSPERVDNTPFGKVRELISQHSSRTPTRTSTPVLDGDVFVAKSTVHGKTSISSSRSPSRQPPPVNRADKPKIPPKPLAINHPVSGRLTPEPQSRRPSVEARISPFSTPPSSNGNSPNESPTFEPDAPMSAASPTDGFDPPPQSQQQDADASVNEVFLQRGRDHPSQLSTNSRPSDPRMMGFNTVKVVSDRTDPRALGFSIPSQPAVTEKVSAVPSRANTVIERSTRDPRDLGFGAAKSTQRAVSETVPNTPPARPAPPPVPHVVTAQPVPSRDARQFGFSTPTTPVLRDESKPNLPVRRPTVGPPPRPSEASKPGSKPPVPNLPPRGLEKMSRVEIAQIPKSAVVPSSDMSFPPPPKRSTFNEDDTQGKDPFVKSLSRAATTDNVQHAGRYDEDSDDAEQNQQPINARTEYPDTTQANRRPPYNLSGSFEINVRSDSRVFDVCGKLLCVSGYVTRVFDMETGEALLGINHGDTVRITAMKFKPGKGLEDEGNRFWVGNNIGELQEIDVATHTVIAQSSVHNRREITRMFRQRRNLMTLDEDGKLLFWRADDTGIPNLKHSPMIHKTPRGHTFSMVVLDKLWIATGKEVRIYRPGNEAQFNVLNRPLMQSGSGDVTAGTYSSVKGGKVYLGHIDGKVSIYSASDYTYIGGVKISDYKINVLSFVGDKLWAAYKTGKVYVYDISLSPWKVQKDWSAHTGPVHGMILDPNSVWSLQRLQMVTAGHDNFVRMWDATLEEDWMESAMQERDVEYCTFRELRAAVITWNVGAIVPAMLRNDFIADAIHPENPPDIIAFGFQEVVDLEDRAVTAKSLLGFGKKKDSARTEQHQSRVYRDWRDHLSRSISRYTNAQFSYSEINTSSLVGLFQCVFVRQEERANVSMVSATHVKCGMGGHYGNKGALVTRFILDDSSICFTNCHLAAGQSQTSSRNNDIATILESDSLPVESNRQIRSLLFVGGGDGTQILDHEICILNGDLNYRIDAIPRDSIIKSIKSNDLSRLLERDQLLVSRRRVAGFRLAPFTELPITFAPTYKYDPGTDSYDTSEKKRSPAWCDRVLYRGPGRIKQTEYRRHEVKVSDHRPVSGLFKIRVKKVNVKKREAVLDQCHKQFKSVKKEMAEGVCVRWLVDAMGLTEAEARRLISG